MGTCSRVRLLLETQRWASHSHLPEKTLPLLLLHGPSLVPEVLTMFRSVSHGTPPISVFEGLYCVKCHAPHDQSLMTFAQQDQLPSHFSRKSVSMGSPFPVGTQVPVYGCEQPFVNCDSHCVFM